MHDWGQVWMKGSGKYEYNNLLFKINKFNGNNL